MLKKISIVLLCLFCLGMMLAMCSCECKKEKCGKIVAITSFRKHGHVDVKWNDGTITNEIFHRPHVEDLYTQYCKCTSY